MKKSILLAWELGAGTGHCVNLLPIAEELLRREYKVVLAVRDLITARRVFQDAPVTYVQAPFLVGSWPGGVKEPETFAQILHNTGFGCGDHLQVLTDAWGGLLDAYQPSAVVCEHAPHALLASHVRGIARYPIGTGFFVPPNVAPLPNLRREANGAVSERAAACELALLDRLNDYLASHHQASLGQVAQLYADADGSFLLTLSELDHYRARGVEISRVGATYIRSWSPSGGLKPVWPQGNGPRLFGYLQPASRSWRLMDLLALLAELRVPSLIHVAGGDKALAERYDSSSVKIVSERVDIQLATRQADVAILNGNAGTATELLLGGVPQLNIPLHLEQALISQRIVDLGAGLMAHPDRPPQIAARLMALLSNTGFKGRAMEFARRYEESPLPTHAYIVQRLDETLLR